MKKSIVLLAPMLLAAAPLGSAWDGDWLLDVSRSSPAAKNGAADGYRFHVVGDRIRWEIPSLGEIGEGRLDGTPFPVTREREREPGLRLSVRREGPGVLLYTVAKNGKVLGGGRMTLVDGNRAWVDLTYDAGKPYWGYGIVYLRK